MARYIDEELLLQKLSRMIDYCEKNKDKRFNALNVLFQVGDAIMDCPTVDAVEVVRCKDCTQCYHNPSLNTFRCGRFMTVVDPNHFCSCGERNSNDYPDRG